MFCSIELLNITASRGASHEVIYYIVLERNEMQKIRSYGEEHHEGPAFGRTPDDDDDQQDSQREISYCVQDILIYSVM